MNKLILILILSFSLTACDDGAPSTSVSALDGDGGVVLDADGGTETVLGTERCNLGFVTASYLPDGSKVLDTVYVSDVITAPGEVTRAEACVRHDLSLAQTAPTTPACTAALTTRQYDGEHGVGLRAVCGWRHEEYAPASATRVVVEGEIFDVITFYGVQ